MQDGDTKGFFAGAVQYDARLSTSYQVGRALSADTADVWCAVLEPFVASLERPTVLDLGCGTGRFSTVIGRRFRARVIGIEPSRQMLSVAAEDRAPNVFYAGGRAERLPLGDSSCDLAWLSHVIHHVADLAAGARELWRVLRRRGSVLVRGTFGDRTDGFPTLFRFFPGAQRIAGQFPTLCRVTAAFEDAGFAVETLQRIEQKTCDGLRELADRTRLRADSTLALLTDAEFQRCQRALERAAEQESEPTPVIETLDLLVLRRTSGARSRASSRRGPSADRDRAIEVSQSLDGDAYARASRHQRCWGEALLDDLTLEGTERVLDLGCGDGAVTARLAERLPHGSVVGIDKSASMIAKARQLQGRNLAFRVMDMEQLLLDGWFDVIFSNAALHWVRDQPRLLRKVATLLRPGGRLVFQMTGSCPASALKAVVLRTANEPPHHQYFPGEIWPWYEPCAEEYARLLEHAAFTDVTIEDVEVPVVFRDAAEVAAWLAQPTLVPFVERMPAEAARAFVAAVTRDVLAGMRQAGGRLVEQVRRFKVSASRMVSG